MTKLKEHHFLQKDFEGEGKIEGVKSFVSDWNKDIPELNVFLG